MRPSLCWQSGAWLWAHGGPLITTSTDKCHRTAQTDAYLLWAALDGVQGRKAMASPWRGTRPPTPTGKLIILPLETTVAREGTIRLAVFTKLESHFSQRVVSNPQKEPLYLSADGPPPEVDLTPQGKKLAREQGRVSGAGLLATMSHQAGRQGAGRPEKPGRMAGRVCTGSPHTSPSLTGLPGAVKVQHWWCPGLW